MTDSKGNDFSVSGLELGGRMKSLTISEIGAHFKPGNFSDENDVYAYEGWGEMSFGESLCPKVKALCDHAEKLDHAGFGGRILRVSLDHCPSDLLHKLCDEVFVRSLPEKKQIFESHPSSYKGCAVLSERVRPCGGHPQLWKVPGLGK